MHQGRTQDFFKGGGGGGLKSGPKYFAPENLKIAPAEKSLSGRGGGGGRGKRTPFFFVGSPKKIATTQPAEKSLSGGGGGGGGKNKKTKGGGFSFLHTYKYQRGGLTPNPPPCVRPCSAHSACPLISEMSLLSKGEMFIFTLTVW